VHPSKPFFHCKLLLFIEILLLVFTRVGTYLQRGSKFCFVVVVVVLLLLLLVGKSLVKLASLAVY
jgi:hypothetical protein